jgi:hypothetical protein
MKDWIIYPGIGAVLALLVIFALNYEGPPEAPIAGPDGKISGEYAIEGIMRLGKPYVCTFQKTDGVSKISGVMHTDSKNIYGEFKISTDLVKGEFSSFLLVKEGEAYTWTSLSPAGYKSPAAQSASGNSSPQEQAQIIGTGDEMPYECELWQVDNSIFEIPSGVTFTSFK